ncbi:MAG: protein kinase [Acidobacteria bacterium]|nr:protein kinase [Acidobacteriota bacterium]
MAADVKEDPSRPDDTTTPVTPPASTGGEFPIGFPVEGWDRYEFIALIAEGGMGRVYKAMDRVLMRPVALKFLRDEDPGLVERFMREARTQAQVHHENICKVYEVGEIRGRHYIAMQFIEGDNFAASADRLPLEQKIVIMKRVAEAVQAAHRVGLIHRDLKPSNVMIEPGVDGGWVPYVVDFGLARDVTGAGLTLTGVALGTPAFMAPEQAHGGSQGIDRRTDVYGLGATLYAVLAKTPPFQGASALEVMVKVLEDEPVPLDRAAAGVPKDISRIVMKCLEKDRQRRYDSAKAVAEDLQRYLDGEPVLARPAGLFYRLTKKARRNPAVVWVASAALIAVLVVLGLWTQTRRAATQRAQAAQAFGQKVARAEDLLWKARTIELHDTRPTVNLVRKYLGEIERDMKSIGPVAEGPGSFALGRGHLALGEIEEARAHLERAWKMGYQNPDVAYSLGHVLGLLYRRELIEVGRIADTRERDRARAEAERTLREPALEYLRQSAGNELTTPVFLEALLAFYENKYQLGAEKARAAFEQVPWLYQAKVLEGKSLNAIAIQLMKQGRSVDAREAIESAGEALRRAAAIGRSDPEVYAGLATLYEAIVYESVWNRGGFDQDAFDKLVASSESCLRADPDHSLAYETLAEGYLALTEYNVARGADASQPLEKAIAAGTEAVRLDPNRPHARSQLGYAYWEMAKVEAGHKRDPRALFDRAEDHLKHAASLRPPDYYLWCLQGLVSLDRAGAEVAMGTGNPRLHYETAISSFRQASTLRHDEPSLLVNVAVALQRLAELLSERSPEDARLLCEQALGALEESMKLNPQLFWTHHVRGDVHGLQGSLDVAEGHDPAQQLNQARACYLKALELNPQDSEVTWRLSDLCRVQAQWEIDNERSPDAWLSRARGGVRETNPVTEVDVEVRLANIDVTQGRWEMHVGRTPLAVLGRAQRKLEIFASTSFGAALAWESLAEVHMLRARWLSAHGGDPARDLEEALNLTARALPWEYTRKRISLLRAETLLLKARRERSSIEKCALAREALTLLEAVTGCTFAREKHRLELIHTASKASLDCRPTTQ